MLRFPLSPRRRALSALLITSALLTNANAQPLADWDAGVVLDLSANSRGLETGLRDQGLGLGHSDLLVRGPVGTHFSAEGILSLHTRDGRLEHHLESAWLQTRTLPQGLGMRAGRFASQVGYLNEMHPHTDDFTERPLLYRGFLGGHWVDDGLRLNWTAPTALYLRLGAELFTGQSLVRTPAAASAPGVTALNLKTGDDLGTDHSWQFGVSHLIVRREAPVDSHSENMPADSHSHSHAPVFGGQRLWMTDLVWKWSPQGRVRHQQLRLVWEYAQLGRLNRYADSTLRHAGSTLSAVWRFHPTWEAGLRRDWLRVQPSELDDGAVRFASGRLRESAAMIAFRPTHQHTLRLQFVRQSAAGGHDDGTMIFAHPASRSVHLQYVVEFGAHGAHAY